MSWKSIKQIPSFTTVSLGELFSRLLFLPPNITSLLVGSTQTDANGSYRLSGLTTAIYQVAVPSDIRFGSDGENQPLPQYVPLSNTEMTARENQSVTAPLIKAARGSVVEVRVADQAGQPLSGVLVSSRSGVPLASQTTSSSVGTDEQGISRLRLPVGKAFIGINGTFVPDVRVRTWIVVANGKKFALSNVEASVDGKPSSYNGNVGFSVASGQTHRVTFRLQPNVAPIPTPTPILRPLPRGTAALTGRVVYANGQAAPNVKVTATMQQKERWAIFKGIGLAYGHFDEEPERTIWEKTQGVFSATATTDEQGVYRFNGLTTAPYNLTIGSSRLKGNAPDAWVAAAHEGVWAIEGEARLRTRELVLYARRADRSPHRGGD